jgi:hypothetical protein
VRCSSQTASIMSDAEVDGGDITGHETNEGGSQPALGLHHETTSIADIPICENVGRVSDLNSLADFVRQISGQHLNGKMTQDEAFSIITSVIQIRNLHETYCDDEICAVVESNFDCVADAADQEPAAMNGQIDLPGLITADELQAKLFEPVMFVIPSLIAEGLTLLAGKPKLGKSWLTLDIALAIASGKPALGNLPTLQGQVLALCLEDNRVRLQTRIAKLMAAGEVWPSDLSLATEWPRLDEGGLSDIENWCR